MPLGRSLSALFSSTKPPEIPSSQSRDESLHPSEDGENDGPRQTHHDAQEDMLDVQYTNVIQPAKQYGEYTHDAGVQSRQQQQAHTTSLASRDEANAASGLPVRNPTATPMAHPNNATDAFSLLAAPTTPKVSPNITKTSNHGEQTASVGENGRPVKRLKLSVRKRHSSGASTPVATTSSSPSITQTTLDRYRFAQSTAARPLLPQPDARPMPPANGALAAAQPTIAAEAHRDGLGSEATPMTTKQASRRGTPSAPSVGSDVAQNARQQPQIKREDKRTLRSQDDGPRLKSELATYFPNYEEIMFDVPRPPEFLTVDSSFWVTEDVPKSQAGAANSISPKKQNEGSKMSPAGHGRRAPTLTAMSSSTSNNLYNGYATVDLPSILGTLPSNAEDPLTDAHFLKAHRRAERKEKQLRNIEKEKAMHEKVQLDRLLAGLQGHDWLKVLGITGVTDGEARKFEAKRDYFIAEVQTLVGKFRTWKEMERKARLDKEEAAARAAREAEEGDSSGEEADSVDANAALDLRASISSASTAAARQLQQEAAHALRVASTRTTPVPNNHKLPSVKARGKLTLKARQSLPAHLSTPQPATPVQQPAPASASQLPAVILPWRPPSPITSFFEKRHVRDAALGQRTRTGGRAPVLAFGLPVPVTDMDEREFALPEGYITEDFLKANARERRRRKREADMKKAEEAGKAKG